MQKISQITILSIYYIESNQDLNFRLRHSTTAMHCTDKKIHLTKIMSRAQKLGLHGISMNQSMSFLKGQVKLYRLHLSGKMQTQRTNQLSLLSPQSSLVLKGHRQIHNQISDKNLVILRSLLIQVSIQNQSQLLLLILLLGEMLLAGRSMKFKIQSLQCVKNTQIGKS